MSRKKTSGKDSAAAVACISTINGYKAVSARKCSTSIVRCNSRGLARAGAPPLDNARAKPPSLHLLCLSAAETAAAKQENRGNHRPQQKAARAESNPTPVVVADCS